ncbi:MAG TPA: hypothetical protein VJR29_05970, partial [bacterium]|nr:hypothetical protein [bacterium]
MADFSGVSTPSLKSLQYAPSASETSKGLVQPGTGGTTQDPALVAWFEQANAYYNAVMAGDPETPRPTEMEWNDFLAQLQWAQTTLYGNSGMTPGMGGPLGPMGGQFGVPQGPQSNQFGGMSGTMDNWVYTEATAKIGFTGNGTHDIWSNDITIDVAPVSGHVTVEQTTDTRSNPPESVVKVTVNDPATGTEAVYFIHDFDPSKDTLKINTPEEDQVTNNAGFADGVVTWGEFTPGGTTETASQPDASIEGEKIDENTYLYEPEFAGETINFWANPNGADATGPQVHTIYADANISVKPSDEVAVTMNGDILVVTVTHTDGSTDVYNVQKGYNANINQKVEYVTIGGDPATDGIPEQFSERLTLNGATETTEPAAGAVDADALIEELKDTTGLDNDNQLVGALQDHGFLDSDEGIEELKEKMTSDPPSFPPSPPTLELIQFLESIDVGNNGLKEALAESAA